MKVKPSVLLLWSELKLYENCGDHDIRKVLVLQWRFQGLQPMLKMSSIFRRLLQKVRAKKMEVKPSVAPWRNGRKLYQIRKDQDIRGIVVLRCSVKCSSSCSRRAAFFVGTFAKCARRRSSRAFLHGGATASCTGAMKNVEIARPTIRVAEERQDQRGVRGALQPRGGAVGRSSQTVGDCSGNADVLTEPSSKDKFEFCCMCLGTTTEIVRPEWEC